jgi:dTDP-4-amino-4,6-dideoxygalactose transaminase
VFVDIDSLTYNLDPTKIESAITPRTKAIMPVHLFGLSADMDPILSVARAHNVAVIEDAAQAIGAWYRGKSIGMIGTVGCFSFFPSKNLGGAGDGGLVTTNDPELAERIKVLRVHGTRKKYQYDMVGMNSRLDAIQAAILRVKLRHLPRWTEERQRNADRYRTMFRAQGFDEMVTLPVSPEGHVHVYNQFVIRVQERDALRESMRQAGIPTEIYYPAPLHTERAFSKYGYIRGDFPEAEAAAQQSLALPIYAELTEEQQAAVVDSTGGFFKNTQESKQIRSAA